MKKYIVLTAFFMLGLVPAGFTLDTDIRINSIGFLPSSWVAKQASIAAPAASFSVKRSADNSAVFSGTCTGPVANADTSENIWTADFSAMTGTGTFYLDVPGVGRSVDFKVADDVYNGAFKQAMEGFYLWRCGMAVSKDYKGDHFAHGACHTDDGYLDNPPGTQTRHKDGSGGWHDAGDYNKYIVNGGITLGMLFMAWEHFKSGIAIADLSAIPPSGSLPLYLAEIKYETDWFLSMQAADGSVYHKLSAVDFCALNVMPEAEFSPRYFVPYSTAATADFTAVMAMAARAFQPYDSAYAAQCLNAARLSYTFLSANPANVNSNDAGFSTGSYTTDDKDDRLWAAAEMWETTGEAGFLNDFETRAQDSAYSNKVADLLSWSGMFDWQETAALGTITYLESARGGKNAAIVNDVKGDLITSANNIVAAASGHGYRRTSGTFYYWGCNGGVARQALILQAANIASPSSVYQNAALDILGYLFGRNTHDRSYVTGLGINPPLHPHDRRSIADSTANPWPGYLVGGEAPSTWVDSDASFATNEIAINWQAGLVYALSGFLYTGATPTPTQTPTSVCFPITCTPVNTPSFTPTPDGNLIYDGDTPGFRMADGLAAPTPPGTITETATGNPGNAMQFSFSTSTWWLENTWNLSVPRAKSSMTHIQMDIKLVSGSVTTVFFLPDWGIGAADRKNIADYVPGGVDYTWKTITVPIDDVLLASTGGISYIRFVCNQATACSFEIDNVRIVNLNAPTAMPTRTPANTATSSPVFTATPTASASGTPSMTKTMTMTAVPTFTFTPYASPVNSSTAVFTITPSQASTPVPSATLTVIMTATASPTATIQPVPSATLTGTFEIKDIVLYPDPFIPAANRPLSIRFTAARALKKIKISVYTPSLRLIREFTREGPFTAGCAVTAPNGFLENTGSGVYYVKLSGEDAGGNKAPGKTTLLVVMR